MDNVISYKKILVPVDFSDCARKAFYVALRYAKAFDAETVVLHVREQTIIAGIDVIERTDEEVERMEKGVYRRLQQLVENGGTSEVDMSRVQLQIAGGKPWIQIVNFAHENDIDLIVMGTHGQTGLKSMLIGGQAEKVVRRANCHVLVVKPAGFDSTLEGLPKRLRV